LEFVSHPDIVAMSSAGSGERVAVQHLTAQLLPLLGIKSFLGTIPADDISEQRGSLGVLISYEFWKHHFGGNPKVLGQPIFVDTWSATVVAVLEPGFNLFGPGLQKFMKSTDCQGPPSPASRMCDGWSASGN
jgi:hypothetical protein